MQFCWPGYDRLTATTSAMGKRMARIKIFAFPSAGKLQPFDFDF
jgi:hypothetical protein